MYFDQCSIYAQILLVSENFPSSLFFSVLRACLWPIIQPSCMLLLRGVRVPFKRLNSWRAWPMSPAQRPALLFSSFCQNLVYDEILGP